MSHENLETIKGLPASLPLVCTGSCGVSSGRVDLLKLRLPEVWTRRHFCFPAPRSEVSTVRSSLCHMPDVGIGFWNYIKANFLETLLAPSVGTVSAALGSGSAQGQFAYTLVAARPRYGRICSSLFTLTTASSYQQPLILSIIL